MRYLAVVAILIIPFLMPGLLQAGDEQDLVVAFLSDIKGYLADCGCPGNVQGGLARRAAYLSDYRQRLGDIPLLHLDVGGFASRPGLGYEHTMRAIMDAYRLMDVDAVNISELEVYFLQQFLTELNAESEIPFISANIVHENSGEPMFQQALVIKRGGLKIGITGCADHGKFSDQYPSDLPATILDPAEALPPVINELRQNCDVVILMAHEQHRSLPALLKKLPRVDLVVAGDGYTSTYQPETIGGTPVSYGGNKGRKIMLMHGYELDSGQPRFEQEMIPVTLDFQRDGEIVRIIESAQARARDARSSRSFRDEVLQQYGK
jgi:2',3'-cyclic-nucleotide 2'-phosphodiesterase (5'-nucleotidase family)